MTDKTLPAPAEAPLAAPKHDLLRELLADVNAKLHTVAEVLVAMQAHGDLHDDHVDLAKSAKTLANEAHDTVEAIRKGA